MDSYSSGGEDLVIKTRKPYTITKQRERWTEEEHNRFLEALKLYGRAWQRIEEHIGTKTAVQIRSHAQKFFTKLEKEAGAKGVPIGQALDIEIPPPRPKRKPSNPYPRKTSTVPSASQVGTKDGKLLGSATFPCCKQVLDFEKEPCLEKSTGEERPTNTKENHNDSCSGVFTLLTEAHCTSVSPLSKVSMSTTEVLRKSCTFREFVPSVKDVVNHSAANESHIAIDDDHTHKLDTADMRGKFQDNGTSKPSKVENACPLHDKSMQGNEPEECSNKLPADDVQATQNYPRHIPVDIIYGSLGNYIQTPLLNMSYHESLYQPVGELHAHPNIYSHPAVSTTTGSSNNTPRSAHQPFPPFMPSITPNHHNQDEYRSLLQMSSTISSLIVSTLLQNPAAHAAASYAANYWPCVNVESSVSSSCNQGGFPSRQSAPSMAALAAATVAAATAWWAAHGLLPLCVPLHAAFTHPSAPATAFQSADTGEVIEPKSERKETIMEDAPLQDQQHDPEHSEAIQAQTSASKLPEISCSDSEESGGTKANDESKDIDCETTATAPENDDPRKTKCKKQVDRSSCGSNTPSSSDVETDALEKQENGKEQLKENDADHPVVDTTNRRGRNSTNLNDSWKEVSEEGRLAFQALFSRESLPQSFSPPHDMQNKVCQKVNVDENKQNTDLKDGDTLTLELTNKRCRSSSGHQDSENKALPRLEDNEEEGLLTFALGNGKLKARRTGFKPYRRCSMEAKENMMASTNCRGEEREPKRVRLEGEAST